MRERTAATTWRRGQARARWLPAIVLGLVLGAAANAQAAVVANPTSLTFGPIQADMITAKQTVTLTNNGASPVTITDISKVDDPTPKGGAFGLSDGSCKAPHLLPATNGSCTMQVDYRPKRPTSGTPHTATVTVTLDTGSGPTIALSGTATPSPQRASFNPLSLTFSPQLVGSTSPAQTVTVRNTGNAPLAISGATITGANPTDFAIASNTCANATLPAEEVADEDCTVAVTFTPAAAGARGAVLHFTDDAADTPDDVPLNGTGTAPAAPPPPPPPPPPPAGGGGGGSTAATADSDGDNVVGSADLCPTQKGIAKDGCPDGDKDGASDRVDKCPDVAGDAADGCPRLLNANIRGLWKVNQKLSKLVSLSVTAPVGSRIEVRCTGKRGACSFEKKTIRKTTKRTTSLTKYFKPPRVLPAGTSIRVLVTRTGRIGTYKQLVTRTGRKLPKVTARCLDNDGKPVRCT